MTFKARKTKRKEKKSRKKTTSYLEQAHGVGDVAPHPALAGDTNLILVNRRVRLWFLHSLVTIHLSSVTIPPPPQKRTNTSREKKTRKRERERNETSKNQTSRNRSRETLDLSTKPSSTEHRRLSKAVGRRFRSRDGPPEERRYEDEGEGGEGRS